MRIHNNPKITSTNSKRTTVKSDGATFSVVEDQDTGQAAPVAAQGAVQSVDALLALQAVEEPLTGKKKTMAYGHDLLDQLDALKLDLLAGQISEHKLNRLISLIKTQRERHGDGLDQLMDDIELRAKVELAKYQSV